MPAFKSYAASLQSLAFLSVRQQIICLDDLERAGVHLSMRDVLGLVSYLREQKRCKVVLILNEGELDEKDAADFRQFNEKVIDASTEFSPTPAESVHIALSEHTPIQQQLGDCCVTLGISNIRLIKKVERLLLRVAPVLKDFDENVLRQAVQSLTVLGWCHYSESTAPSIEFLKSVRGIKSPALATAEEAEWNARLDELGYFRLDDFDLILLDGIEKGFFDQDALASGGAELDAKFRSEKAHGSLSAAWDLFHDSFDDNEEKVVNAIFETSCANARYLPPANLSTAVSVLKDLGAYEKADELLSLYVREHNSRGPAFFDLDQHVFAREVDDPDVRAAFDAQCSKFTDDRLARDVLIHIAKTSGWSPQDIVLLRKLTVDDFYKLFHETTGTDLARVIRVSLDFGRTSSLDSRDKAISEIAKQALIRIGKESPLNQCRVKRHGVSISDADNDEANLAYPIGIPEPQPIASQI
jgi:hypothetical protein